MECQHDSDKEEGGYCEYGKDDRKGVATKRAAQISLYMAYLVVVHDHDAHDEDDEQLHE